MNFDRCFFYFTPCPAFSLPSALNDTELSERLFQILSVYGRIVNIKASRDTRGRPFAFVQFEVTSE